jgi:hypothetical protein
MPAALAALLIEIEPVLRVDFLTEKAAIRAGLRLAVYHWRFSRARLFPHRPAGAIPARRARDHARSSLDCSWSVQILPYAARPVNEIDGEARRNASASR